MRILALDHGAVRCGCALSDPTGTIVRPIEALTRAAERVASGRRDVRAPERGASEVRRAAETLLANTVIETFNVRVEQPTTPDEEKQAEPAEQGSAVHAAQHRRHTPGVRAE